MLFIVQNNMAPAGRALCGFYCFILPGKMNVNYLSMAYFSSLVSRTDADTFLVSYSIRAAAVKQRKIGELSKYFHQSRLLFGNQVLNGYTTPERNK